MDVFVDTFAPELTPDLLGTVDGEVLVVDPSNLSSYDLVALARR